MEKYNKKQPYESKYFNIDKFYESTAKYEGWKKEDFAWVIQVLESLPKEKLVAICEHPEVRIRFTSGTFDDVDEEQLVNVVLSDTTPKVLLKVLKEMGYERK